MYPSSPTLTVLLPANSWTVASPPGRCYIWLSRANLVCKNPCYRAPLTGTPPHYLLSKSQFSSSYKLHHSLQRTIFVHFVFVSTSHFVFVSTFHFVFVSTFHFVFVSTSPILYLIPHFLFCICAHVSYLHLRAYFQLVFIFTHLFPTCVCHPTFEKCSDSHSSLP